MDKIVNSLIELFDKYIFLVKNNAFYERYICNWPQPLNDPSIIGIVLIILIAMVVSAVFNYVRNSIYMSLNKKKRRQKELEEKKRFDENTIKVLNENASANASVGESISDSTVSSLYTAEDIDDYKRVAEILKKKG